MLGKIKAGLQRFMAGRYGIDELNKVILVLALIACVVGMFVHQLWISIVYWLLIIYLIFRIFSRNTTARWKENEWFLGTVKYVKVLLTQSKDYKIFRCKKCKRIIRVPRKHGRVEVTCPQCGEKKVVETGKKT